MIWSQPSVAIALCLLLTACDSGGGGGDGNPLPEPPSSPPAVGLQRAFPQLRFSQPTAMEQPPGDGSVWFLAERAGRVWRFDNDEDAASPSAVIDLSDRVATAGEGGLLGMAFHPHFADNGRVYLSYTAPGSPLESRVSEFRSFDGGLTLAPDSQQPVLAVLQDFANHNGGHIAFGPDGFLYIGLGDGGSANDPRGRAQDTTNLLGAMLRIDVDGAPPYGIPEDNPFAGNPHCVQGFGGADCPEIFAWGLRNPWRWSFDGPTGAFWLGDVGQRDLEEVDLITVGGNYGWPVKEGSACNPNLGDPDCVTAGFIDPVTEYGRELGQSITGGYVYHGRAIPNLQGDYLFADFVSGRLWRLARNGAGVERVELFDSSLGIVSFAQDVDGELYLLDLNGGGIYRLVDAD